MSSDLPEFEVLYGESSHKKRKMWSVEVQERERVGVIITRHGYEDGKQVVNERVVTSGKNLGRANATTPLTQAIAEAQGLWNKKRDAGYVTNHDASASSETFQPPLPMLAQDYNKRGKDIKFPCLAQRKLDGVRCVAIPGVGLFSRNGKPMSPLLRHITEQINSLPEGTILDGELYSDTLTFQELVGWVKKKDAVDVSSVSSIYLCVYDIIREGVSNQDRIEMLEALFASHTLTAVRLLQTVTCTDAADVKRLHGEYLSQGYEGIILRNMRGLYKVGHRSVDLQKYKEFIDAEYVVKGFKEGDGIEKGCVIWICAVNDTTEFCVRPRGTHKERTEAFKNAASMIGRSLTVRYQELTDDGLPRFPVGIAFRDYE